MVNNIESNNGFDVGDGIKSERDRGPSSASVVTTATTSPENEDWSDADLGTGGPPTPAGAQAVEVILNQHHQPFTVGTTAFCEWIVSQDHFFLRYLLLNLIFLFFL